VRPFKSGDILIIETPSVIIDNPPPPEKYTAECTKVFSDGMIMVRYKSHINNHDITAIFNANGESIDGHDVIKTIRKPQKGGKEARGIVSMLCKEYRRFLNDSLRTHLKFKAACVAIRSANKETTSIRYVLYISAKSILK